MYFESLLLNVLVILLFIIISFVVYLILNKHAILLSKYSSKCNMNSIELVNKFNKDNNMDVKMYPSNASSDLDIYMKKEKSIFINARNYYSDSIYSLSRVMYLCCYSLVDKNKFFSFFEKSNILLNILEVLGIGACFVGLLLKNNIFIIVGLCLIFLSFILVIVNYKFNKSIYDKAYIYFSKLINKEKDVYKVIYRFELIKYVLSPFICVVKLFPFLMCEHDKKMVVEDK